MHLVFKKVCLLNELERHSMGTLEFNKICIEFWLSLTDDQKATINRIMVRPGCPTYMLPLAKPPLLNELVSRKLVMCKYSDDAKANLYTATSLLKEIFKHGSYREYGAAPGTANKRAKVW